ncbi:hypothetical protein J3Q64DRAFT_1288500 [Phycomyces blakesleeanus]|uniref:Uncharacterized protein n=1 Tax=Phycomyces blakesleeanus TaxID=4837 RepID=A0ABR3APQ8_PHYBL
MTNMFRNEKMAASHAQNQNQNQNLNANPNPNQNMNQNMNINQNQNHTHSSRAGRPVDGERKAKPMNGLFAGNLPTSVLRHMSSARSTEGRSPKSAVRVLGGNNLNPNMNMNMSMSMAGGHHSPSMSTPPKAVAVPVMPSSPNNSGYPYGGGAVGVGGGGFQHQRMALSAAGYPVPTANHPSIDPLVFGEGRPGMPLMVPIPFNAGAGQSSARQAPPPPPPPPQPPMEPFMPHMMHLPIPGPHHLHHHPLPPHLQSQVPHRYPLQRDMLPPGNDPFRINLPNGMHGMTNGN